MRPVGVLTAARAAAACILVLLSACSSGALTRPLVIGASVSDGAASTLPARDHPDGPRRVLDLATALDAWIVAPHDAVRSHADGTTFLDPVGSVRAQITQAIHEAPSIVFATDALFWSLYAPAASDDVRRARFAAVLAELEKLRVPILIGDVPDMRSAVGSLLSANQVPSAALHAKLNAQLRTWATTHSHVTVLSLAELVARANQGESVVLRGTVFEGERARGLIADDHLHASADGVMALAAASLDALIGAGVIAPGAVRDSWSDAQAAIVARRSVHAPETIVDRRSRFDAVTRDFDAYIEFTQLERANDPSAIERGLVLIASRPSLRGPSNEKSVASSLVKRWPDSRRQLEDVMRTAALRAGSERATFDDLVGWSLVAAGLGETEQLRSSARAWCETLRLTGDDVYDLDADTHKVAARVFAEITRCDAAAGGLFWPDPVRVADAWQRAWDERAALTRAARVYAPDAKLPGGVAPREQVRALEAALRSAGRTRDADRLRSRIAAYASAGETD